MERTLCVADTAMNIIPDGISVNTNAFNELYSGSVFNEIQKRQILNRCKKCARDAHAYLAQKGSALWNNWMKIQTEYAIYIFYLFH